MAWLNNLNQMTCGKNYKVHFEDPDREICRTIYGEMQNFNPSKEVVIYVKNKGIFVFPYSSIISMIPIEESKLSSYDKERFNLI